MGTRRVSPSLTVATCDYAGRSYGWEPLSGQLVLQSSHEGLRAGALPNTLRLLYVARCHEPASPPRLVDTRGRKTLPHVPDGA
jgi:hypothetical protein